MSKREVRSSILRCEHCGKLITRLAWEGFKFTGTYRCCSQMHLTNYDVYEEDEP